MISKKVSGIKPSLTLEITAKAKKMKASGISVISFGAGEPDFNTPDYIIEAAKHALDIGFTKYTPASGMQELKIAVCEKLKKDNGLDYEPAQIVISSGAKSSLYHAVCAIVDEGDEVILPSPYWLTYPELVGLAGGKTMFVETKAENGYKITPSEFESAVTEKTKAFILNSPNNPTGAVYSQAEIAALAKVAEKHGVYVISDEIYEKLVYGGAKHYSIAACSEYMKEQTIIVNGVSKTYSMTGWRIGYSASPIKIAKAISSMQSHTTSNACSIAQYASVAALQSPESEKFVSEMQKEFNERRKLMMDELLKIKGLNFAEPAGAFYVFADISELIGKEYEGQKINGSLEFADAALKKGVAVIPGVAFGSDANIRLSYATSKEDIKEGLKRLADFVKELK